MKWRLPFEGWRALVIWLLVFTAGFLCVFQVLPMGPGIGLSLIGLSSLMLIILLVFYRDPRRTISASPDEILAPADGRILRIENIVENRFLKAPAIRVAIFMHLGNVHIQRMPADGCLTWTEHFPGKYLPVLHEKAAAQNEQRWYGFTQAGRNFTLVQIAGMFAKRTHCWIALQGQYPRGERLGMISLGSEVDLYLPADVQLHAKVGQKVFAGKTSLGKWHTHA